MTTACFLSHVEYVGMCTAHYITWLMQLQECQLSARYWYTVQTISCDEVHAVLPFTRSASHTAVATRWRGDQL